MNLVRKVTADWDIESFERLMVEIQCYFCKAIPQPQNHHRYKCINNGHSLCDGCKEMGLECPCGSGLSSRYCRIIESLMKRIPWYCCNFKYGCREMYHEETALTDHQIECIYRQIRCCFPACPKELSVKDILDHQSECCPGYISFDSHKAQVCIPIQEYCAGYSFFPVRFEAHANTFFLNFMVDRGQYRIWMLMLSSSPDLLKNYEWNIKIPGVGKDEFKFRGEPFPIEKHYQDVVDEENGFAIGCKKAMEIQEKLGKFVAIIEICNLKEEAKDSDVESGVSSDGESSK